MQPTWDDIWLESQDLWDFESERKNWIHSRLWYQIRSAVRMVIWGTAAWTVFVGWLWMLKEIVG